MVNCKTYIILFYNNINCKIIIVKLELFRNYIKCIHIFHLEHTTKDFSKQRYNTTYACNVI